MLLQGGIAKFDTKAKTFTTYSLPPDINDNAAQIAMVDPLPNGQVITNDVDKNTVHLLNPSTGQWQTFGPFKITDDTGLHSETEYGVLTDAHNNAYALDFSATDGNYLGKVDYATHQLSMIPTPTKNVRLRRGHFNAQNQLAFAEFAGNQIGIFDANTGKITEYKMPTQWSNPYDAVLDKHGEMWTGNMSTDLITRLDPKTGNAVDYLLPRETNVRRVFVDNSTSPVTFWVGDNRGAAVIKLEPGD
jgi:streptogramin lyase